MLSAGVPVRSMAASEAIHVELVYALPAQQQLLRLSLPAGTTLGGAIEASGLLRRHPEIDLRRQPVGIFGRLATLDTGLHDGDRVEIHRPLQVDPKDARRARAAKTRRR